MLHSFLLTSSCLALAVLASFASATVSDPSTPSPKPYGALPSPRQIAHAQLETYAFLHFTVNTFTDREWGNGDEDESVFNPDGFNPDQIVLALKAAGMKG